MRLAAAVALIVLLAGLLGAAGLARSDAPPKSDEPTAERWSADPRLWLALIEWRQRLRLELESSRELCTAGTLTEISWQIAGGTPPYSLEIEGSPVAADTDNVRINCGALTEAEAADEGAELAAKRINAVVTDARGVRREAAIEVARARALPALMVAGDVWPYADALSVIWDGINTSHCGVAECFVVRWRSLGATAWTVEPFQPGNLRQGLHHYIDELTEGAAYEAAAAAIRDRIEIETPDVLNWTTVIQGATLTAPTGLITTSTHDTITLRWDRQPSAKTYFVFLNGPDGGLRNHLSATDRDTWGDASSGFHKVVFHNLPADTEFKAIVASLVASEDGPGLKVQQTVRTQPAPAGHEQLPRGPQNLRLTVTDTTITASWDEPFNGAPCGYIVRLYHPAVEKPWLEWVWAPDLAVTFSGLQPNVAYRLSVEQLGPVAGPVEVSVATTRLPSGVADAIPPTPLNPEPPPLWPPPFSFVWPQAMNDDGGIQSVPRSLILPNLPERLRLELESSRELCTAGTLTEISWTIGGGTPPYSLEIEGSLVAADADNVRINCGALTEAEAADEEAELAAKRINAVVTDARGVRREAAIDVARARALPPLLSAEEYGDTVSAYRGAMGFEWHAPATPYSCRSPSCYAIRWRAVGADAWTYAPLTHSLGERNLPFGLVRGLADGVAYEAAGAAMRDPIELQTPEALQWTSPLAGTTLTDPTGLTATATHDTVTVRWDRQPSARFWSVNLYGPDGALGQNVARWDTASWGDPESGVHEVVFRHLPASTRYEVMVRWSMTEGYEPTSAKTSVETLPLPIGREPLLRGPQNLRATATHDSITVMWDQPFAATTDPYWLYLFRGDDEYGARHGTAWHPNTQFTFNDLKPGMAYRVVVVHMAIVRASAEVSVTTDTPAAD